MSTQARQIETRTLRQTLVILYFLSMGILRAFTQLFIVNFDLGSLHIVPFVLSISYLIAAVLLSLNWRVGIVISTLAVAAQILTELYMAFQFQILEGILLDLLLTYGLDIIVLVYILLHSIWNSSTA